MSVRSSHQPFSSLCHISFLLNNLFDDKESIIFSSSFPKSLLVLLPWTALFFSLTSSCSNNFKVWIPQYLPLPSAMYYSFHLRLCSHIVQLSHTPVLLHSVYTQYFLSGRVLKILKNHLHLEINQYLHL